MKILILDSIEIGKISTDGLLILKGSIAVASDFPFPEVVENGWTYKVTADVTDNDPTRTNTGQSFSAGSYIAWNGTAWEDITGIEVWIIDGDDVKVIENKNVNIQDKKLIAGSNTEVYELSGDTYIENKGVDKSIIRKLGDALGSTFTKVVDSAGVVLASISSLGVCQFGKTSVDGVVDVKDSSNVSQVKFNANGDSYVKGGNMAIGHDAPQTAHDVQGGITRRPTVITDSTYTLLNTDSVLLVDTTSNAITIDIPTAQMVNGRKIFIKDLGNAGTNAITFTGASIDGGSISGLNVDYSSIGLIGNGGNAYII